MDIPISHVAVERDLAMQLGIACFERDGLLRRIQAVQDGFVDGTAHTAWRELERYARFLQQGSSR